MRLKDKTAIVTGGASGFGEGIALEAEADESSEGPAHMIVKDPDGNTIMLDQHR